MPKESPPGPNLSLKDLEAVAREGARLWPHLAPLGGSRWTRDDISWAVSMLYIESRTERFARAVLEAKSKEQVRNYLLKALRNHLLKRARRLRGLELLDAPTLDALPASKDGRGRLAATDLAALAGRALEALTISERATAGDYFRGDGASGPRSATSTRTCERHRARLRKVVCSVAIDARLTREEAGEFVTALADRLAGGGDS